MDSPGRGALLIESSVEAPGMTCSSCSQLRLGFLWEPVFGHVRRVQVAEEHPVIGGSLGAIPEEDLARIAELDPVGPVAEPSLELPCRHHEAGGGLHDPERLGIRELTDFLLLREHLIEFGKVIKPLRE